MKRAYLAVLAMSLGLAAVAQTGAAPQSPSRSATSRTQAGTAPAPAPSSRIPTRIWGAASPGSGASLGRHGFGHRFVNPCSVGGLSPLTPSAMGCLDPQFTSQFYFPDGRNHGAVNLHPRFFSNYSGYGGYVYPYPVVEPEAAPGMGAPVVEEAEPPAPTIFERRAQAAPVRAAAPSTPPSQPAVIAEPAEKSEHVPTVLVFRDGSQVEVMNYAIVGQTLYDLGSFVSQKIPLSELNLKATIKANEERGLEFNVPASAVR